MGALTVTMDSNCSHQLDQIQMMTGKLSFSNSYAPGGDTWIANQFGLGFIQILLVDMGAVVPFATYPGNSSSGTLKAYVSGKTPASLLQEVQAGTDLSSYSFRFQAWGW